MIDLRLQVNGTQQVERTLHIAADHISDFSPAFRDLKNAFVRYQREEFKTQGAHGGHAWAALSPKYLAWKRKHFPGRRILELTGGLRKTLTSQLQVFVSPRRLVMWSASKVATYHQGGAGNLPARKIIAVPQPEKRDWVRILQRYVLKGT